MLKSTRGFYDPCKLGLDVGLDVRGQTGGEAKGRIKRKIARRPIDAGVVAGEPREVGQRDELKGNFLRVAAMDANVSRIEVGKGGGKTTVDKFN